MPEFHFRHGRIHLGRRSSSASGFPGLTVSLRGAGVKSLAFPSVLAPQMRKPSALITRPPCPPVPCSCPETSHRRGILSGRERPKASAWGNPPRLTSREVLPPPDPDPVLTPGERTGDAPFPGANPAWPQTLLREGSPVSSEQLSPSLHGTVPRRFVRASRTSMTPIRIAHQAAWKRCPPHPFPYSVLPSRPVLAYALPGLFS